MSQTLEQGDYVRTVHQPDRIYWVEDFDVAHPLGLSATCDVSEVLGLDSNCEPVLGNTTYLEIPVKEFEKVAMSEVLDKFVPGKIQQLTTTRERKNENYRP
jgi:hypothetical protein